MNKPIPEEIYKRLHFEKVRPHSEDPDPFPAVVKIDPIAKQCEDCDLVVEDRRIDVILSENPVRHWRRKCVNCNLFKNPDSGIYDLTTNQIINHYRQKYKSQINQIKLERKDQVRLTKSGLPDGRGRKKKSQNNEISK